VAGRLAGVALILAIGVISACSGTTDAADVCDFDTMDNHFPCCAPCVGYVSPICVDGEIQCPAGSERVFYKECLSDVPDCIAGEAD